MRNAKCEVKSPVVSGFAKWQIANGKCITFESDDSTTLLCRVENLPPPGKLNLKNLLQARLKNCCINKKIQGGPPSFEGRYTALDNFLVYLIFRSPRSLTIGRSAPIIKNWRYTSKLVRYILLHKMRYISLRSMRYDINPSFSRAIGTYRTAGISRTRYISQIRQDLYRGASHPYSIHAPRSTLSKSLTSAE